MRHPLLLIKLSKMKLSYDPEVDIAYLKIDEGLKYANTESFSIDNFLPFGMINIDLSSEGKIIGFEVSYASKYLSKSLLESAKKLS